VQPHEIGQKRTRASCVRRSRYNACNWSTCSRLGLGLRWAGIGAPTEEGTGREKIDC
ncbi:hypothetical protein LEMLEM_LOCUS20751, partial [Lemmus lemmus]